MGDCVTFRFAICKKVTDVSQYAQFTKILFSLNECDLTFSSTRTRGILKFQFFVVSQKRDYFYDDYLSGCETTFVKENFCRCCSIEEVGKSCHMKKCYWTKWHPFLFYQTKRYFITLIFLADVLFVHFI